MIQDDKNLFDRGPEKARKAAVAAGKSSSGIAGKYLFPGSVNLKKELVGLIHGADNKREKIALKGQLIDFIRSID